MKQTTKITDHALLRYLERVKGIDVKGARQYVEKALDKPRIQQVIDFTSNADYKIKTEGITYCFRGGVITTCYPE